MKETRKSWACLLCKNRRNDLQAAKCSTCSASRPLDRFVVRRDGGVYLCKAITGLPIPMLSILQISASNEQRHIRMQLPMNHDTLTDCVQEGLDLVHYGAHAAEEEMGEMWGGGSGEAGENGLGELPKGPTLSTEAEAEAEAQHTLQNIEHSATTNSRVLQNQSQTLSLDHSQDLTSSAEKSRPVGAISLFDKMMHDASQQAYDPSIGRFISTSTVELSPNRDIIKTDLSYIHKMEHAKKEMQRVVDTTIKRREIEKDRQAQLEKKLKSQRSAGARTKKGSTGSRKNRQQLIKVFDDMDVDKSGAIDRVELKFALDKAGLKLNDKQLDEFFKHADNDGNGQISREEWFKAVTDHFDKQDSINGEAEADEQLMVFQQLTRDEPAVKETRAPCALCEHVFPLSALMGRVTFKAVSAWRAAHAAPIPAEDKRFNSAYIHNAAKLCLLCTTFFDADFSECLDKYSIHEAIGLDVDPIAGVQDMSNKESRQRLKEYSEIEKDSQRPLSAIKHKVAVQQIQTWANRNNDPNAKFLYDPKANKGQGRMVDAAADTRSLRDTYTDTVVVKQLQKRGEVEERSAREREAKRRAWLDRLSGKTTSSPPKKDSKDKSKEGGVSEAEGDAEGTEKGESKGGGGKDGEPKSARSDAGPKGAKRRGTSRSPSLSRSKTAGDAASLSTLGTVSERRGRRARRAASLTRRGGSVASLKSEASASVDSKRSSHSQSVKSLSQRRGKSATALNRNIKSSGYTATPWGVSPFKKKRGSSLPARSRTADAASDDKRSLKPRTYSKASVPRLSGRARKEARLAPKPVARKPLLVTMRDKSGGKGVVTVELIPKDKDKGKDKDKDKDKEASISKLPSEGVEPGASLAENILNGVSVASMARTKPSKRDKVVPIEPLLRNKRVSKQQEELIRGAATAYNPLGKYSPPDSKKKGAKSRPSVITRSTHAATAVPSAEEAARKKQWVEEQIQLKQQKRRSLSPPKLKVPNPDPPPAESAAEDRKVPPRRPTLEIAAVKPKAAPRLRSPPPQWKSTEVEPESDISDEEEDATSGKHATARRSVERGPNSEKGDDEDDEYIPEPSLLAKAKSANAMDHAFKASVDRSKSGQEDYPDEDEGEGEDEGEYGGQGGQEYDFDFPYDPQEVVLLAEHALNEVSHLSQGDQEEAALPFAPGEDTMADYMFASAGAVQKPENPDKWSPSSPIPEQRKSGKAKGGGGNGSQSVESVKKILFALDDADTSTAAIAKKKKHQSPKHAGFRFIDTGDQPQISNAVGADSPVSVSSQSLSLSGLSPGERNKSMRMSTLAKQQQLINRLEERQQQQQQQQQQRASLPHSHMHSEHQEELALQKNLADAYSFLGDACTKKGNMTDALNSYENSFRLEQDALSLDPETMHKRLEALVSAAISAGDQEKATHLCEELVSSNLERYGERSVQFAKSELFIGSVLMQQDGTGPADAMELISDALGILNESLGPQHALAAEARSALETAKVAAAVAVAQKRSSKSKASNSSPSPTKPVKSTSEHLTSSKKHKDAVEREVQKRIADEVAQKVAAEKKKMMQQMEKQMAEQMAKAQAAMMEQMQAQLLVGPVSTAAAAATAQIVSQPAMQDTGKSLASDAVATAGFPAASSTSESSTNSSSSDKPRLPEDSDAVLANISPSLKKLRVSTPAQRYAAAEDEDEDVEENEDGLFADTVESAGMGAEEDDVLAGSVGSQHSPRSASARTRTSSADADADASTSGYIIDTAAYEYLKLSPDAANKKSPPPHAKLTKNASFNSEALPSDSPKKSVGVSVSSPSSEKHSPSNKKSLRLRSPPPPPIQNDSEEEDEEETQAAEKGSCSSPSGGSTARYSVIPAAAATKPHARLRSPPPPKRVGTADSDFDNEATEVEVPLQVYGEDEEYEDDFKSDEVAESEDAMLMQLALGGGEGEGEEDHDEGAEAAAYSGEEFLDADGGNSHVDDGAFKEEVIVDENAQPNTPPKKTSSRPSSVNRKLRAHVENARGMELIDKGKTPVLDFKAADANAELKGMKRLSDGRYELVQNLGPNDAAEALENMRLLSAGSSPMRGVLRSREAKTKADSIAGGSGSSSSIKTEQISGMVMLSKGSGPVLKRVMSITSSELSELSELTEANNESVSGNGNQGEGANVKRRIKKMGQVHF